MYKITAPNEKYDRKIGGLRFVDGVAETESEWLASWFSGRVGFSVETIKSEDDEKATAEAKKAEAEKKKAEAAAKKAAKAAKEAEKQKESADDGDSGKSKEAAT